MSKRLTATKSVMITAAEFSKHLVAITILSEIFYQLWKEKAFDFYGAILGFKGRFALLVKTQRNTHTLNKIRRWRMVASLENTKPV